MKTNNRLLLLPMLAPLLVSCIFESTADTPMPYVPFRVIASGDYPLDGLQQNKKIEVFTDQASFNSSLSAYTQPTTEHTVDFSSSRVVLLSLGGRGTGGSSIKAEKIDDYGSHLKVTVLIVEPGGGCAVTQSLTSPYEFIEIESVKELLFEERFEMRHCNDRPS